MNFFIPPAYAQSGGAHAAGGFDPILIFLVFAVVMVLFMVLPQMRRSKEHRKLMQSLDKGNEVVTTGGVAGRIRQVGENFLVIEVAEGTEIRVQKSAITSVLPKGTLDSL